MPDSGIRVQATITAQNTGTDWLQLRANHSYFDISVSGIDTHTVHLQRKRPSEAASAARDIESYTADAEKIGEVAGHWDVRLFIKTGNFGTADVEAELGV